MENTGTTTDYKYQLLPSKFTTDPKLSPKTIAMLREKPPTLNHNSTNSYTSFLENYEHGVIV